VFSITLKDVEAVWPKNGLCPAIGLRLRSSVGTGPGEASPTLDRLVPSRGYVPGNIAVISMLANRIKSSATTEQVARVAAWMRKTGLN
jgi:hypothetical protein